MPDYPFPLMVFAAGFGTRMGALTQDEQKLMVQLTQKIVARTREVQSAMAEGNA